jgi:two-component system cell cycle sensor histidine kinase/response regulator CckA
VHSARRHGWTPPAGGPPEEYNEPLISRRRTIRQIGRLTAYTSVHKLLQRQLQQFLGAIDLTEDLGPFLAAVSEAYAAAEQERTLLERSLGVTSQALLTRNKQLQRDLAAKRKAEESRERSLSVLQATLETTADGILVVDLDGRVSAWNQRFAEMWQMPRELLAAGDAKPVAAWIAPALIEPRDLCGSPLGSQLLELKDGRLLEHDLVAQYLGREVIGRVCSFRDVTAAHQAAEAQAESEERYRILFEASPQPMWVYDTETLAFLAVNRAAAAHYGWSRQEFLAMTMADLQAPEDRAALPDGVEAANSQRLLRHRRKDGTRIIVELLAHNLQLGHRPARLVVIADVTERQRIEEHLRQTQKMEAIGRLAGGVAHDFNNLLTVISGYAALLDRTLAGAGPSVRSHVDEIQRAAGRAAALTHQLLAFSRQQVMQQRVVDLNALLANMRALLTRIIGEDILLAFTPAPDLGRVLADPGQLEQVLMNLVVNARDAMPHGGTLTLETANSRLEGREGGEGFAVAVGDYVRLTVSDTGVGMDATVRSRAFEPFFTTKEVGKGTGLGLSTVYGVVKQTGGYVWLESEPRQGCAVHVYLPRVEQAAHKPAAAAPIEGPAAAHGTVVLAEDEEAVRSLVAQVLADCGYHVVAASSAREALDICRGLRVVDLLLTDVVMPEVNGSELARQVTLLHPNTKVLFMSGYADRAIDDLQPDLGLSFLEKPFLPAVLVQRVREMLGEPAPAPAPPSPRP